jgi:hypothetical protein
MGVKLPTDFIPTFNSSQEAINQIEEIQLKEGIIHCKAKGQVKKFTLAPPKSILLEKGPVSVDRLCYVYGWFDEETLLKYYKKVTVHEIFVPPTTILEFETPEELKKAVADLEQQKALSISMRPFSFRHFQCTMFSLKECIEKLIRTLPSPHIHRAADVNLLLWADSGYEEGCQTTVVRVALETKLLPGNRTRSIRWMHIEGPEENLFQVGSQMTDQLDEVINSEFPYENMTISLNKVLRLFWINRDSSESCLMKSVSLPLAALLGSWPALPVLLIQMIGALIH